MYCPKCGLYSTHVLESRPNKIGHVTRRRRKCKSCCHKFTTYESLKDSKNNLNHYRFTDGQIRAIYKLKDWYSTQELAELFNCSMSSISKIKRGQSQVLIEDGIKEGKDPDENYTQTKKMLKGFFLRFKRLNNQEFTDLLTDCLN